MTLYSSLNTDRGSSAGRANHLPWRISIYIWPIHQELTTATALHHSTNVSYQSSMRYFGVLQISLIDGTEASSHLYGQAVMTLVTVDMEISLMAGTSQLYKRQSLNAQISLEWPRNVRTLLLQTTMMPTTARYLSKSESKHKESSQHCLAATKSNLVLKEPSPKRVPIPSRRSVLRYCHSRM